MKEIIISVDYLHLLSESKLIEKIDDLKDIFEKAANLLVLDRVILYQKIKKDDKHVKVLVIFSNIEHDYEKNEKVLIENNLNLNISYKENKISSIPVSGIGEDYVIPIDNDLFLAIDDINIARKIFKCESELLYNLSLSIKTSIKMMKLLVSNSYDHLTNVLNRQSLDNFLDFGLSPFGNKLNNSEMFIFIDIDHFGDFNKTYGHAIGDMILKSVATTLKKTISKKDNVYRYGGEEFVISILKKDFSIAEKLRKAIENMQDSQYSITISLGVSYFFNNKIEAIINSNHAMLEAKRTGRNKVVIFNKWKEIIISLFLYGKISKKKYYSIKNNIFLVLIF